MFDVRVPNLAYTCTCINIIDFNITHFSHQNLVIILYYWVEFLYGVSTQFHIRYHQTGLKMYLVAIVIYYIQMKILDLKLKLSNSQWMPEIQHNQLFRLYESPCTIPQGLCNCSHSKLQCTKVHRYSGTTTVWYIYIYNAYCITYIEHWTVFSRFESFWYSWVVWSTRSRTRHDCKWFAIVLWRTASHYARHIHVFSILLYNV